MASPQLEDGYVRIARELLSALSKHGFSGSEFMVLLAVIGKTYGWNKSKDEISITQFMQLTGLSRRGVCKATLSLVNKKALGREQKGTSEVTTYWIIKDYDKWVGSANLCTSAKTGKKVGNKKALPPVPICAPTIEIPTKDTIQKTSIGQKEVSPTKIVQDFFYKQHLEVIGEAYVADFGKDGAIFKGIVKILPPDRVKQLITYFFKSDDEFIKRAGYTVGVFKSQINKLRTPGGSSLAVLELQEMMDNAK